MKQTEKTVNQITEGIIWKQLLYFFFPILLGTFFQQLYNTADAMVVGRFVGKEALACVGGSSSQIINLIVGFFVGLSSGATVIIAQYYGARDEKNLQDTLHTAIAFSIVGSFVISILGIVLSPIILRLMNTPEYLMADSLLYLRFYFGGIIFIFIYNIGSGILRAVGDSKNPLYFLIFSCSLNLLLDLLAVTVFSFGVAGIAGATVLAQLISSVLCFLYLYRNFRFLIPSRRHFSYNKKLVSELVTTGFSMGLMNSIFSIGSVILQGSINTLGTSIIAAHTAARRIVMIGNMPLASIASANATFVSQNFGAGRMDRIRDGIRKSSILCLIWSALFLVMILTLAKPLVKALAGTDDPVIMSNALMNLHINMIFFFPLGVLLTLRMTLQGINYKTIPLISSSMELVIKILASFVFVPLWGYAGASVAEPFSWLLCMLFLLFSYIRIMKKEKIYS